MPQALVFIEGTDADAAWVRIGALVTVTQRLPPRLAIVQGEDDAIEAVRGVPGVRLVVAEDAAPASSLEGLTDGERLFAEAWQAGRSPKSSRPGQGLPWDAEGFQPPDGPRRLREEP